MPQAIPFLRGPRWLAGVSPLVFAIGLTALAACTSTDRSFGSAGGSPATAASGGTSSGGAGTAGAGGSGIACNPVCQADAYCNTSTGQCASKKATGNGCASGAQCVSGFCVDSVCCATACTDACGACSAQMKGAGKDGDCGLAAAGTDPHDDCPDQGAMTCGTDGMCDGTGGCEKYAKGTACGQSSCAMGTQTNAPACDGSGKCLPGGTTACAPFVCDATACKTTCATAIDCVTGDYCSDAGSCAPKKAQGAACGASVECTTGFCVDGYCCNTACTGICRSCDGLYTTGGVNGTCDLIDGADPYNECAGLYLCCSGLCKSSSVCL